MTLILHTHQTLRTGPNNSDQLVCHAYGPSQDERLLQLAGQKLAQAAKSPLEFQVLRLENLPA